LLGANLTDNKFYVTKLLGLCTAIWTAEQNV